MKKIIIALLVGIILICFNSCMPNEEAGNITEALKISTWVMDKNLEGTGYWEYDNKTIAHGHWVSYESDKQLDADDVFKFEQLSLNEVRTIAPLGYKGPNLNILFEFDGIVEVETEIPAHGRIRLAYSTKESSRVGFDGATVGNSVRVLAPININVCPSENMIVTSCTKTDREYYLNIKTYLLDGTQVISARLKLVALEDKTFTPDKDNPYVTSSSEEWTRFLSIELVSYEYSDVYKMEFLDD